MNTDLSDLSSTQPRKWYHDWAEKLKGIGGGGPNALKYQNPPRLAEDAILTNTLFRSMAKALPMVKKTILKLVESRSEIPRWVLVSFMIILYFCIVLLQFFFYCFFCTSSNQGKVQRPREQSATRGGCPRRQNRKRAQIRTRWTSLRGWWGHRRAGFWRWDVFNAMLIFF